MGVEISISDPAQHGELTSLENWLLRDACLRACTITRPPTVPKPGEMGAVSEVLVVALGSGGSGAALATALSVWLRSRVSDLTIRLQGPMGTIELSARTTQDPRELVSAITSLVSGDDGAAG
jgi:Effector Associated Constant Component 1